MIKPLELTFCINSMLGLQSEASKINVKIVSIRKYYISVGFLVLSSFFWKQMQNKIKKNSLKRYLLILSLLSLH